MGNDVLKKIKKKKAVPEDLNIEMQKALESIKEKSKKKKKY